MHSLVSRKTSSFCPGQQCPGVLYNIRAGWSLLSSDWHGATSCFVCWPLTSCSNCAFYHCPDTQKQYGATATEATGSRLRDHAVDHAVDRTVVGRHYCSDKPLMADCDLDEYVQTMAERQCCSQGHPRPHRRPWWTSWRLHHRHRRRRQRWWSVLDGRRWLVTRHARRLLWHVWTSSVGSGTRLLPTRPSQTIN